MEVPDLSKLDRAANRALTFLKEKSERNAETSRKSLVALLQEAETSLELYDEALAAIRARTSIAIHFHPERISRVSATVAEGLWKEGECLTQFDTGISSGSPTGFVGGVRDEWERKFFGGYYHTPEVTHKGRPKYGALILANCPDGPAPRFGSSYLVLHPEVNKRSTYTFGGNQDDLAWKRTGSWDHLDSIFLPVLKKLKEDDSVLGSPSLSISEFLGFQRDGGGSSSASPNLSHALDSYVEAQIHGRVRLREDVEKVVVDRSFYGSELERTLEKLARDYELELEWYDGYTASINEMPTEFRGYRIDALTRRIAVGGELTAAKIGAASNSFHSNPELWEEWRKGGEALTYFRRVWHALVYHGRATHK
ncbi:MAG: DUF3626 domain-containing protein [Saprospiraceae bacterium]|nr:DUF3626 domain-containing protein [Saprospiraceae bacterium]